MTCYIPRYALFCNTIINPLTMHHICRFDLQTTRLHPPRTKRVGDRVICKKMLSNFINNLYLNKICQIVFLFYIVMQASEKTLPVQNQSEKFYVTHLDLFRSRIRNQVKKQQSHTYLYLPDMEIFKIEEKKVTTGKCGGCMLSDNFPKFSMIR